MPLDEGWSEFDEAAYRRWLAQWFYNTGVMYDPDDPDYDYGGVFKQGIAPLWRRKHGNEMRLPYYQWKKQDEAADYTVMAKKLGSGYG